MPFARYFCIFINVGLGELSLAGTASGVIGLNGYVTIPLIISGSRRTLIIQWGRRDLVGLVVKMPDILTIFLLPFRQHVME